MNTPSQVKPLLEFFQDLEMLHMLQTAIPIRRTYYKSITNAAINSNASWYPFLINTRVFTSSHLWSPVRGSLNVLALLHSQCHLLTKSSKEKVVRFPS